jgi:hypothetical protein
LSNNELKTRTLGSLLDAALPSREALLTPWLTERHLSMIYAPTGVGKSWLGLGIALAVAGGGRFLGWAAPTPRRVLLIDGEMDIEDLQERARDLLPALDLGNPQAARDNLTLLAQQDQSAAVKFPDLGDEKEGQPRVLKEILRVKPALVILDNFSVLATVEDENAASGFDPVLNFLRQLKQGRTAALLLHHSRKGNGGAGAYRGTSKMGVVFNSIISLNHPDGVPSTEGAAFDLNFEKYRGRRDETTRPFRARLVREGDKTKWAAEPLEDDRIGKLVRLVQECTYPDQKALATALGVEPGTISKWKTKAFAKRLIDREEWDTCMEEAAEAMRPPTELAAITAEDI